MWEYQWYVEFGGELNLEVLWSDFTTMNIFAIVHQIL